MLLSEATNKGVALWLNLKGVLRTKLKGSTLIESLVGMVIIVGCFGVFLMLFEQVIGSSAGEQELRAQALIYASADEFEVTSKGPWKLRRRQRLLLAKSTCRK